MFAVIFILRAETFYRAAREATLHTQRQTLSMFWIIGVGDVRVVSRGVHRDSPAILCLKMPFTPWAT